MQKDFTEPRFLCDFMVQKLGRILILCGFDTLIIKKPTKPSEVLLISQNQNRIILSRNTNIRSYNSIILKEQNPYLQLKGLIKSLNIKLNLKNFFTRCSICNVKLKKIEKNSVIDKIPPLTAQNTDDFYICSSCNKLYWKQTHYTLFVEKIKTICDKDDFLLY